MSTQKLLKGIRLMTFTAILGIFSLAASAVNTNDEDHSGNAGGLDNRMREKSEQVELEQWMVSTEYWKVQPYSNMLESISLESWMTDPQHFETREQRKLNAIEDWMVDQRYWKI